MKAQKRAVPSNLVKEERMNWILGRLSSHGRVLATDVTAELGVSEDTARRDLRELAAARRVRRVHGGALPALSLALDHATREQQSVPEKKSIARAAASLVRAGDTIFIDGGTTNVLLAESLAPDLAATVITNSIPVASTLCTHPGIALVLLGGKMLKASRVTCGAETVDAIRAYRSNLFFLGTCSLDDEAGITVPHFEEAPVKRAMIAASARVIGLVNSKKIGTAMPCVVGPISDLDAIVIEHGAPETLTEPYARAGVEVIRGAE